MPAHGFTKTPNEVLFDDRLTMQERTFYSMLLHLVWLHRPDRQEGDVLGRPVPMPVTEELAENLGLSLATFKRYLNKLRTVGYVRTERPHRQAALIYTVYARVTDEPTSRVTGEPSRARAILALPEEGQPEDGPFGTPLARQNDSPNWEKAGDPPALIEDQFGHVVAIDKLAALCGIRSGSPRYREVAVALHGNRKHLDTQPGINRLFWLEMAEHAQSTLPEIRARASANPVGYQKALTDAIEYRARLYRDRLSGAPLTPTALAKWWLDLETVESMQGPALTGDDLRRG